MRSFSNVRLIYSRKPWKKWSPGFKFTVKPAHWLCFVQHSNELSSTVIILMPCTLRWTMKRKGIGINRNTNATIAFQQVNLMNASVNKYCRRMKNTITHSCHEKHESYVLYRWRRSLRERSKSHLWNTQHQCSNNNEEKCDTKWWWIFGTSTFIVV